MAEIKHFVVIGLGTFGTAIARQLAKNRCRVTGLDAERERVESLKDCLYEAIIGDVRDREALKHLPLAEANAVVLGLGEDITQSILAALHVKELGARCVIAKGVTDDHGKILRAGRRTGRLPRARTGRRVGRPPHLAQRARLPADRSRV